MTLQFLFDENSRVTSRQVATIFDVFASTGGLMGITMAAATYLIGWIQEFLFKCSIIKRLFFVEKSLKKKA